MKKITNPAIRHKRSSQKKSQASSPPDKEKTFKQAIALNYNESDTKNSVPKVSATGQNEIAEQIIALAKEHGIPIHEDPDLAVLLSQLELYEEIPESLYRVVAEVLAFAYIVAGKTPKGYKPDA